jgi:hypothetical protein
MHRPFVEATPASRTEPRARYVDDSDAFDDAGVDVDVDVDLPKTF